MRRQLTMRPVVRRNHMEPEALPLDVRDPAIVRAKALQRYTTYGLKPRIQPRTTSGKRSET
jgi:hypothetical protein